MATWRSENFMLTMTGREILSKIQAGIGALTISRIVTGGGYVAMSRLYEQTAVTNIKQELSLVNIDTTSEGSSIEVQCNNEDLEEAYTMYQIGIYVTHPDYEGEQLYWIGQCDIDTADQIPLPSDLPLAMNFMVFVEHAEVDQVTITVNPVGSVPITTFNAYKTEVENEFTEVRAEIDSDIEAHNVAADAHYDFTGATSSVAGKRGMVPAPAKGDQNKALFGDATYKSVVQSINGITPTSGDVDINRKFYNSLAQLGLSYQTVTFADIINALPVNSTLTFYVDILTSQPTYAPNLQIPASGLVIVVKGDNNAIPIRFTLSPIANKATTYLGEYTTYNSYGFKGWQPIVLSVNGATPNYTGNVTLPIVLSVNGAKPNINGNVTMVVDAYTEWKWTDGNIVIDGFTVKFPNGYKQCIWYLYFPVGYSAITINFPKAFSAPPCVFGSIVVANDSFHLVANVNNITTTSCRCVTNNNGNTASYWVAMGYDS